MKAKNRSKIPVSVSAKALFLSDRTCCVCRMKGKPIQIHHVDDNPDNHEMDNLAVLCLDCHDLTQRHGGFARRLDAEQVLLYRRDWTNIIARERALHETTGDPKLDTEDIEVVTSKAEILRENKEYALLATHYTFMGIRN